jgi:hypothetical protein
VKRLFSRLALSVLLLAGQIAPLAPSHNQQAQASVLQLGGIVVGWINAGNYATLQLAIDATPSGGTLFVPPGVYEAPDTSGWNLDKAITIIGSGRGSISDGTVATIFRPYNDATNGTKNSTVFVIDGSFSGTTLSNFIISAASQPAATGIGDGIRIGSASASQNNIIMNNLSVYYMGRHGINAAGDGAFNAPAGSEASQSLDSVDQLQMTNVNCFLNRGCGMRIHGATDVVAANCWCSQNRLEGFRFAYSSQVHLGGCSTQDNGDDLASTTSRGQAVFSFAHKSSVISMNCEQFELNTNKNALVIETCFGFFVSGCDFGNPTEVAGTTGINVKSNSRGVSIVGNTVYQVAASVTVAATDNCTGNFIQAPSDRANPSATCPATFTVPAQLNTVGSHSGGNIAFVPLTDQTGGQAGVSSIGAIQLPLVDGTAAFTSAVKAGLVMFDGSAAAIAAKRSIKYYDGTAWLYLQGN